jgi:hypothetical protein
VVVMFGLFACATIEREGGVEGLHCYIVVTNVSHLTG